MRENTLSPEDRLALQKIKHLTPVDVEAVYKRRVLDKSKFKIQEIIRELEQEIIK